MLLKSKLSYLKLDIRSFITSSEGIKFENIFSFYLNSQRFYRRRGYLRKTTLYAPDIEFSFAVKIAQNLSFKDFCLSLSSGDTSILII